MAKLAVGIVGGAIGFVLGGPAGFKLGFTLATFLYGILNPPKPPSIFIPAQDPRITVATYAQPIGRLDGTSRIGGNIIALRRYKVTVTEEQGGGGKGGGGGGGEVTRVLNFADILVSFGEAADGLRRLWANGSVLADFSDTNSGVVGNNGRITVYPGAEDQLPDPLLETMFGAGMVNANRGLFTVLVRRLNLTDKYGNSVPNLEGEVVNGGTSRLFNVVESPSGALNSQFYYERVTNSLFQISGGRRASRFDPLTQQYLYDSVFTGGGDPGSGTDSMAVSNDGRYIYYQTGLGNYDTVWKLDTDIMQVVASVVPQSTIFGGNASVGIRAKVTYGYSDTPRTFKNPDAADGFATTSSEMTCWTSDFWNETRMIEAKTWSVVGNVDGATEHGGDGVNVSHSAIDKNLTVWLLATNGSTFTKLTKWEVLAPLGDAAESNNQYTKTATFDISGSFTSGATGMMCYSRDLHALVVARGSQLALFDITAGAVTATVTVTAGPGEREDFKYGPASDGLMTWEISGNRYLMFDVNQFEEVEIDDFDTWQAGLDVNKGHAYVSEMEAIVAITTEGANGAITVYPEGSRAAKQSTTLDVVVKRYLDDAGMPPSQYNVSALSSQIVRGFFSLAQEPVRNTLERLSIVYDYDVTEVDGTLKFLLRGAAPVRTLLPDELGAAVAAPSGKQASSAPILVEERIQESELPKRLNLTYLNANKDYLPGTQHALRASEATTSTNEATLSFTGALTDDEAKRAVAKKHAQFWVGRLRHEFSTSVEHADLIPSDVVNVDNGEVVQRIRIVETNLTPNLIYEMKGVLEDPESLVSDLVGTGADGQDEGTIDQLVPSVPHLIDVPMLRIPQDDNLGFYMGASPDRQITGWTGAVVLESEDGSIYLPVDSVINGAAYGRLQTALPDHEHTTVQRVTFTARWIYGGSSLQNVTELQARNGSNPFALRKSTGEWELVTIVGAVDNGDGTATFTDMFRGQRGTENTTGLSAGDDIVFLDPATLTRVLTSFSSLNITKFYRADTIDRALRSPKVISFSNTSASVKPYSPGGLGGSWNAQGSLVTTWKRRSRYAPGREFDPGTVPLTEAFERYELVFSDSNVTAGGATYTVNDATTHTYTVVQQRADGVYYGLSGPVPLSVVNGGAETGDLTGWTLNTGTVGVRSTSPSPFDGSFYFGGASEAAFDAEQELDIEADGVSLSAVDAGTLTLRLEWLQATNLDTGTMRIRFKDAAKSQIGATTALPDTVMPTSDVWHVRRHDVVIPANTRFIDVAMVGTRVSGTPLNTYFDLITAVVGTADPTVKPTVTAYMISDIVGRGFPRAEQIVSGPVTY